MDLEHPSKEILRFFEGFTQRGKDAMQQKLNPKSLIGVYVIEVSSEEAANIVKVIKATGNMSIVIDCMKFYDFTHERAKRIDESVNDDVFSNALRTHDPKTQKVICTWIYNGKNAKEVVRQEEDFGVCWAVLL